MLWKNTADRFGHVSVLIHWLVALTVYGMFALGLWMVTLGYYDVWYHRAPEIHKSIGALLFIVMVIRVIWRFVSPPPKPLASYGRLTRVSAILAHLALYAVLFGILISGYLISTADGQPISVFGWFDVPATVTGMAEQADTAGAIHLYGTGRGSALGTARAGRASHHFIDRDVTLKRMLGSSAD